MYHVTVHSHVMIAHSLPDPWFGPAQHLHGATYRVEVTFTAPELNAHQVVIDIGLATRTVEAVLAPLHLRNLDALPAFHGKLTTTEFLARHIHDHIREMLDASFMGSVAVYLGESPAAGAGYTGPSFAKP